MGSRREGDDGRKGTSHTARVSPMPVERDATARVLALVRPREFGLPVLVNKLISNCFSVVCATNLIHSSLITLCMASSRHPYRIDVLNVSVKSFRRSLWKNSFLAVTIGNETSERL
ncbi:uncharacterized protein LOC143185578 [Calliopsis andreniformis]|uniref:uncharacterized protein LOC143185578 n=1 Tax=Calliopsis andreniformis TaxID=337506 RepID=UPI003FCCD1AF